MPPSASPSTARNFIATLLPLSSNRSVSFFAASRKIRDRRQRIDIDIDRAQRVLGDGGAVGKHHRQRLADIANLVARHDRLPECLEFRHRLQPHWHARRRLAQIGRRDDAHARPAFFSRAAMSMERMRPWPTVLRRIAA